MLYPDQGEQPRKEAMTMFTPKGYYTSNGYVGFLPDGTRMMFATYNEYVDYLEEDVAA
jgi:hypothetical protein